MSTETLAELICNLDGNDPNNEEDWSAALADAAEQIKAAEAGTAPAWWEGEEAA